MAFYWIRRNTKEIRKLDLASKYISLSLFFTSEFELRASHMLGWCSPTYTTPSALLLLLVT
jgi:hypothetical protein